MAAIKGSPQVLAFDIGGTHIRIAKVKGLELIQKVTLLTPSNKHEILHIIFAHLQQSRAIRHVGLAVAGYVKMGHVVRTPHLDFNDTSLYRLVRERMPRTIVSVENDAKCAALAEATYGSAHKKNTVLFLTLGTGIGGALIVKGKVYKGEGNAGEFGHMFIQNGEFESIASGTAALQKAKQIGLPVRTGEDLDRLATLGDSRAQQVYHEIGQQLGLGLLNLAYAFDPELIVLGGGFASEKFLYPSAQYVLHHFDIFKRNIPIIPAQLGDDAGLIGASINARISAI